MTLEHIHSKNHLALISLMCTYSINQINYADYNKSLYLPLVEEKKNMNLTLTQHQIHF